MRFSTTLNSFFFAFALASIAHASDYAGVKSVGSFSAVQGAAAYTIPITLPQGINGFTPQLSLDYNSNAGNGSMGLGWNVSGLSAISRCGKSLLADAEVSSIKLDFEDRFCFNGQQLILVNGEYGKSGSEYRTQIDSYQKITAHGQAGNGPAWFEVHTKSGEIFQLNHAVKAQSSETPVSWLVNRISDRFNNQINFFYKERTQYTESVISQISYSLGSSLDKRGHIMADVKFHYSDLDNTLRSNNKIAGSRASQSHYLTHVNVEVENTHWRKYNVTYRHRHETGKLPLVTQIQECVQENCLIPITFDWLEDFETTASEAVDLTNKPELLQIDTTDYSFTKHSTRRCVRRHNRSDDCMEWRTDTCAEWEERRDDSDRCVRYRTTLATKIYYNGALIFNKSGVSSNVTFGDFNNDTLVDFLIIGSGYYLNEGDNDFTFAGSSLFADFNLDGATDKFAKTSNKAQPHKAKHDVIQHFTNADYRVSVTYADGANDDFYEPADPINANQFPITHPGLLVKTIDKTFFSMNQWLPIVSTNFRYGGGVLEPLRYGATGFRWIESSEGYPTRTKTRTDFSQQWPYFGRPVRVQNYKFAPQSLNYQLLDDTTFQYQHLIKQGYNIVVFGSHPRAKAENNALLPGLRYIPINQIYQIWKTKQTLQNNTPSGAHLSTVITNQDQPDTYGNVLSINVETHDHINNLYWKTQTTNEYLNDPTNWLIGRLTQSEVSHEKTGFPTIVKQSAFTYNDQGVLIEEQIEPNTELQQTTQYEYDSFGHKTKVTSIATNAQGEQERQTVLKSTSYGFYGPQGTRNHPYRKKIATNALGHKTTRFYSTLHRKVLRQVDANGLATEWQYDSLGRKIRKIFPDESWEAWRYKTLRSETATPSVPKYQSSHERSNGPTSVTFFDMAGRKTLTQDTALDGRTVSARTGYLGQHIFLNAIKTFIGRPQYQGSSAYIGARLEYDSFYRLTQRDEPDAHGQHKTTKYQYGSFQQTEINPLGHRKTVFNDAKGKTVKVDQEGAIITHEYDAIGRLSATINAKNQRTDISYDALGRKIAVNDPVLGLWRYQYDGFGNLIKQTDAKGQSISFKYDQLNRRIKQITSAGATTWRYDSAQGKGKGKLHQSSSPLGLQKTYHYDSLGRINNIATQWQNRTYQTKTDYDAQGRVEKLTYPNGLELSNQYGKHGHLVAVKTPKNQVLDYDADFIIKQFIKAQQFAELAEVEIEYLKHQHQLYSWALASIQSYSGVVGIHIPVSWQQIITELSQHASESEATIVQMQDQSKEYRRIIRRYRNYLNSRYKDAWTNGSDYLEAQTELAYLKAQKLIELTQAAIPHFETLESLERLLADKRLVEIIPYNPGYHSMIPGKSAKLASTAMTALQNYASNSLDQAITLQSQHNNFLTMLGDNAKDEAYITWYRVAQTDVEGRVTQALYGNALFTNRDYSPDSGQLLSIQTGNMIKSKTNDIQHLAFQYDALNNLTQKEDYVLSRSESMAYDHMDRIVSHDLTAPDAFWNHQYSYNEHGDIIHSPAGQYLYGDTNGLQDVLLSVDGHTMSYDANGNVTRTTNGTIINYNAHNKPTLFKKGNNSTGFSYDANGMRFLRTINGQSSLYVGNLFEHNLTTSDTINHIFFGNQQIASYEQRANGTNQTTYLHKDALGNIDVATNQQGDVVKRYAYEAFGKQHDITPTKNSWSNKKGALSGINLLPHSANPSQWDKWGAVTLSDGSRVPNIQITAITNEGGPLERGYAHVKMTVNSLSTDAQLGHDIASKTLLNQDTDLFIYSIWLKGKNNNAEKLEFSLNVRGGRKELTRTITLTNQWNRYSFSFKNLHKNTLSSSRYGRHDIVQFGISSIKGRNHAAEFYVAGAMLTPAPNSSEAQVVANFHETGVSGDFSGYTQRDHNIKHGYTGHEHFQVGTDASSGFIHMNGRVYDPNIGRFLSADPYLQAPLTPMSHNRYAYVLNNPYKYTDPSGYFSINITSALNWVNQGIKGIVNAVNKNAHAIVQIGIMIAVSAATGGIGFAALGTTWGAIAAGAVKGMIAGFAAGLVGSNGNFDVAWDGMRSGAVSGGIQAGIFSTIGDAAHAAQVAGTWKHSAMHAFGGGVSSAVQGGEFWQGAVSQGITHYSGSVHRMNQLLGDGFAATTAMSATLGGSISSLSGGSFENGAMTAAFAHMYNDRGHGHDQWHNRLDTYGHYGSSGNACGTDNPNLCSLPPMDGDDQGYRKHDIDYYNNDIKWTPWPHSNPIRNQVDLDLVNTLSQRPHSNLYQQIYRQGAYFLFDGDFYNPNNQ